MEVFGGSHHVLAYDIALLPLHRAKITLCSFLFFLLRYSMQLGLMNTPCWWVAGPWWTGAKICKRKLCRWTQNSTRITGKFEIVQVQLIRKWAVAWPNAAHGKCGPQSLIHCNVGHSRGRCNTIVAKSVVLDEEIDITRSITVGRDPYWLDIVLKRQVLHIWMVIHNKRLPYNRIWNFLWI